MTGKSVMKELSLSSAGSSKVMRRQESGVIPNRGLLGFPSNRAFSRSPSVIRFFLMSSVIRSSLVYSLIGSCLGFSLIGPSDSLGCYILFSPAYHNIRRVYLVCFIKIIRIHPRKQLLSPLFNLTTN